MANSARPSPAEISKDESLVSAIDHLADEVRVLSDVLENIREDISWVTRNGVPHQPQEHVIVKRMAVDPLAGDWSKQLELVRLELPAKNTHSDGGVEEIADECVRGCGPRATRDGARRTRQRAAGHQLAVQRLAAYLAYAIPRLL